MRSSNFVRLAGCTILILALFTGIVATASAQAATPEPTTSVDMMNMMIGMEGACPQGMASQMLNMMMTMTPEAGMSMTENPMMMTEEATMEMNMTESPMMATEEATSMVGAVCLFGQFSGAAEVPAADPDGMGVVFVSIDPSSGTICYEEAVSNITLPASATHIHSAAAGTAGPVVVPFPTPPDASGLAADCTSADTTLANDIAMNPANYYVNVHTSDFPSGAIRAQLAAWDDATMKTMMNSMGMSMSMTPGVTSAGSTSSSGTGSTSGSGGSTTAATPAPAANTPMPPAATAGS